MILRGAGGRNGKGEDECNYILNENNTENYICYY